MNRIMQKKIYSRENLIRMRCSECGEEFICGGNKWFEVTKIFRRMVERHLSAHRRRKKYDTLRCREQLEFNFPYDKYLQAYRGYIPVKSKTEMYECVYRLYCKCGGMFKIIKPVVKHTFISQDTLYSLERFFIRCGRCGKKRSLRFLNSGAGID